MLADQLERIRAQLKTDGHEIVRARTGEDALTLVQSRTDVSAALVSWDLRDDDGVTARPRGRRVLMPGENAGGHDEPTLRYLRALEPSTATGDYWITCLKE